MNNIVFENSESYLDGGAISIINSEISLYNITFTNVTSFKGKGGAIFISKCSIL